MREFRALGGSRRDEGVENQTMVFVRRFPFLRPNSLLINLQGEVESQSKPTLRERCHHRFHPSNPEFFSASMRMFEHLISDGVMLSSIAAEVASENY